MIILNFAHLLTTEHLAQIEALSGRTVEQVVDAPAQFDHAQPFAAQATALVDSLGLSSGRVADAAAAGQPAVTETSLARLGAARWCLSLTAR